MFKEPKRINILNVQKYKHDTFKLVASCEMMDVFVLSMDKQY